MPSGSAIRAVDRPRLRTLSHGIVDGKHPDDTVMPT